ncbi:hypothetical protein NPX13_g3413 [Xylaria arbuscula]|uniref:Receptor L-domain domain-containing protein n=1 Tax=Xylaria arbuscula TaxID=114810 RepID=A0A9W8NIJ9_9PEZI|nr:hypothetical protein NPX13_g3413 [Xylaria arbuscula]
MSDCPSGTFTITNQGDADRVNTSPCGIINIYRAKGRLNFTNLTGPWETISVSSSPELERLEFAQSFSLNSLHIKDATSLNTLSLQRLIGENISYIGNGSYTDNPALNLNITNAPELIAIYINTTSFRNLELLGVPAVANDAVVPAEIVTALSIYTDSCLNTYRLEAVGDLRIVGVVNCNYQFLNLKSVGNLSIANAANFNTYPFADVTAGSLIVNESMILDKEANEEPHPDLRFDRVSRIGKDLNITSYANVAVSFDGLVDIGTSIVVSNNTNCTFNFDHVSSALNLFLLDNIDSTLPLFPELETVENVHLRGYIDTSTGPNIFPVLTLARGTVLVEPWNSDFNCSALVFLKNNNKINNLICNGTDNGTSIPTMSLTRPDGLTLGAKVGIGVGSGILGLGVILALSWLILHFQRRLKSLETARLKGTAVNDENPAEDVNAPQTTGMEEADGTGIIREKPDDHLIELRVKEPELPEDHLVELPAGTT